MPPLARVTDPAALDLGTGGRARLGIQVPRGWLRDRRTIEVAPPRLLSCARCDGGGCDACGRSGAFAVEPGAPPVRVRLPEEAGTFVLRIVHPWSEHAPEIEQLHLEVQVGEVPSEGVCGGEVERPRAFAWLPVFLALALLAALLVLATR